MDILDSALKALCEASENDLQQFFQLERTKAYDVGKLRLLSHLLASHSPSRESGDTRGSSAPVTDLPNDSQAPDKSQAMEEDQAVALLRALNSQYSQIKNFTCMEIEKAVGFSPHEEQDYRLVDFRCGTNAHSKNLEDKFRVVLAERSFALAFDEWEVRQSKGRLSRVEELVKDTAASKKSGRKPRKFLESLKIFDLDSRTALQRGIKHLVIERLLENCLGIAIDGITALAPFAYNRWYKIPYFCISIFALKLKEAEFSDLLALVKDKTHWMKEAQLRYDWQGRNIRKPEDHPIIPNPNPPTSPTRKRRKLLLGGSESAGLRQAFADVHWVSVNSNFQHREGHSGEATALQPLHYGTSLTPISESQQDEVAWREGESSQSLLDVIIHSSSEPISDRRLPVREAGMSFSTIPRFVCRTQAWGKLLNNITIYFERSCQDMTFDDNGVLTTSATSLYNNFDSYCFTATMFKEKGWNSKYNRAIRKASLLVDRILLAEHPRTLACFFEVFIHLIQSKLSGMTAFFCELIRYLSKKLIREEHPWGQICQLLRQLDQNSLAEALPVAWEFMVRVFERQLGDLHPLAVSVRLDYIKRVYVTDPSGEERHLRSLLVHASTREVSIPRVMLNLAHNLNRQKSYFEAKEIAEKVLSLPTKYEASDKRTVEKIESLKIISRNYFERKDVEQAEPTIRQAIEIIIDQWGKQHPWVLEFMSVLEGWLRSSGKDKEANTLQGQMVGLSLIGS